jgi:hypothetical protein
MQAAEASCSADHSLEPLAAMIVLLSVAVSLMTTAADIPCSAVTAVTQAPLCHPKHMVCDMRATMLRPTLTLLHRDTTL